jgi:hypothetical protein
MPVIEPDASGDSILAFQQGIAMAIASNQMPGLPGPSPTYRAQEVYYLGLTELVASGDIRLAQPVAWRYLTTGPTGQSYTADVTQSTGSAPVMASLSYGPAIEKTLDASRLILTLDSLPASNFTLRVLAIPGIQLEAYWLVSSASAGTDLVVPYLTLSPQLPWMEVFPRDQFQVLARKLALQVLAYPGGV